MKTQFKSALDKIEAEDVLVEKTEKYLKLKMRTNRKDFWVKKLLVASIAAVFMIGTFIGGYAYINTPVAYISFDINPSVELGVNAFNVVVSAEGINEDGEALLSENDIINTDLTEALNQLIDSAAENDYIKDDGTTVVSITTETNNGRKAEKLSDIGERAVNAAMEKRKINAIVYKDCSDLSLRTEAKDLGISPGKYKLIKNVQALDPEITVEELKDAKVSDIMLRAHQLIDELDLENSNRPEQQQRAFEKMKEAAKRAEERIQNSVNTEFEAAKEQVRATFEEAKKQAEGIKDDAKSKAKEIRDEAKALVDSVKDMTDEEKAEVAAKAEELRKQAEELIKEAEKKAAELKEAAEKKKAEAIEAAERAKEAAKLELEKAKQKREENKCGDESTDENSESKEANSRAQSNNGNNNNNGKGNR